MGKESIRIACIGDSITDGFGLDDPDEDSYPNWLQYFFGDDFVVNPRLGACNAAIWRNSWLPYKTTDKYIEALNWPADFHVICLGSNDSHYTKSNTFKTEFREDYLSLIGALKEKSPNAKLLVCFIPPMPGKETLGDAIHVINDLISAIASSSSLNATVVDLYTPFSIDPLLYSEDGVHPNLEGAKKIAHIVYESILREQL